MAPQTLKGLYLGISSLALCTCWVSSASAQAAQTPSSAPPQASADDDAADIIVTANKRAQSINDVPMSITALDAQALVQAGVSDIGDLERLTPGYTFTKVYNSVPVLTIRGVGYYDNSLAAPPAVSSYVDEVPLPYPVLTAGALLDLERVEILKGPQGTLFGQNSTGGAINFIAGKPEEIFRGSGSLGYGRFNTVEASAMVTGPLTSTLSGRAAVRWERGDKWQRSYTHGGTSGETDRGAARLILAWEPSSGFRADLAVEGWYDKSDAQAGQLVGLNLSIPGNQNQALASGSGEPGDPIVLVYPRPPRDSLAADWTPDSDYASDNKYYRASLRLEYDLSDTINLTSITAYQDLDYKSNVDPDGTALRIAELLTEGDLSAFYQEVRVAGELDSLRWMIGGNYSSDKVRTLAPTDLRDWSVPVGNVIIVSRNDIRTLAAFSNLEYKLTDRLTLQGSIRYTDSRNRFGGCAADSGDGAAAAAGNYFAGTTDLMPGECYTRNDLDFSFRPGLVNLTLQEDNVSWRASLAYEPSARVLLYANMSKGYKAGAFPFPAVELASQALPAKQESLLAYEAGFKVSTGKFQLNGAGFYYDYSDKQLLAPFDFGEPFGLLDKIQNIPSSRIAGAEMQVIWKPVDGLQITAQGTHVDSRVNSAFLIADGLGSAVSIRGERFPFTPKWQGLIDADYSFPLAADLVASAGVRVSGRSSSSARLGGRALYDLKGYALVDLRVGIATANGKYAFDIWGNNVTDRYYRTNTTTFADTIVAYAGAPATYGARVSITF